jgi:hypothetical protein
MEHLQSDDKLEFFSKPKPADPRTVQTLGGEARVPFQL